MNARFTVDEERVVYEILEGEIVVVNLESGNYYIVAGTAAEIWKQLMNGATPEEVVDTLALRYPGETLAIREAVRAFVEQLLEEGLMTASDRTASGTEEVGAAEAAGLEPNFTPPVLHRYTDMATLIQMDPIHDFDETGWPRRPIARDR